MSISISHIGSPTVKNYQSEEEKVSESSVDQGAYEDANDDEMEKRKRKRES